jgi:cytidylate kinase
MVERKYNLALLAGKVITIDGPAGSGKSTTARILAARLGYQYLDTGAMYRALTHFALKLGVPSSDGAKLKALADNLEIVFRTEDDINHVIINGEDVTEAIRTPEVTRQVSEVSAHAGVRSAMVAKQREIGKKGSIVAEGRDTTTVVFPKADIKFYMDASVEQRAQRRVLDLGKMGISTSLVEQAADIRRRDEFDSNREHSPLTRAKDAYHVDTTKMTIEEQTEHMLELIVSVLKKS